MTAEKEYLIYLISCFLNGEKPEGKAVDWEEMFRLADIQDIGAVISNEIKALEDGFMPKKELNSKFKQLIGRAVQSYEKREKADSVIKSLLNENCIDFILVKGSAIKSYYPVKEFRTSGDTDIIVRNEVFEKVNELFYSLEEKGKYNLSNLKVKNETLMLYVGDLLFELHNGADVKNDYFSSIFDFAKKTDCCEYILPDYYQLMYVFLHFVKHLVDRGAGIRMLMDMDVLIRSIDGFDSKHFYKMCEDAGELNYAKLTAFMLKKAFKTPIEITDEYEGLYDGFFDAVLDGGSFGYLVQTTGFYHFNLNNGDIQKINTLVKLKTAFRYIFPPFDYVRSYREYSKKYAFLTPFAYIGRAKDALFKRRGVALNTFRQIADINDKDIEQRRFLEKIDKEKRSKE